MGYADKGYCPGGSRPVSAYRLGSGCCCGGGGGGRWPALWDCASACLCSASSCSSLTGGDVCCRGKVFNGGGTGRLARAGRAASAKAGSESGREKDDEAG